MCDSIGLWNAVGSNEKSSLQVNSRLSRRRPGALSSWVEVVIVLSARVARGAVIAAVLAVVVIPATGSLPTSVGDSGRGPPSWVRSRPNASWLRRDKLFSTGDMTFYLLVQGRRQCVFKQYGKMCSLCCICFQAKRARICGAIWCFLDPFWVSESTIDPKSVAD